MVNTLAIRRFSKLIFFLALASLLLSIGIIFKSQQVSAACASLPTDKGTATTTVNIPVTGSYRIWSRIMAPDTSSNSYFLEVDDTTCGVVVGDNSITANQWTWVDHRDGNTASKITINLSAGNHTIRMVGREAGVKLDRVVLTSDTTCVPTGTGDNCANPPDTTPPVVAITSPINGATVTGNLNIAVNATDESGISKVELKVDGVLKGADTTPSYSFVIDTSQLSVGSHVLTATAFDTSGNQTTSSSVTINVQAPPDTTAPTVSLTSPTNGQTVSGTITLSANASDAIGVTKVEFLVDNQVKATDTTSPYSASFDTKTLTNGSHTISAKAYDAANNSSTSAVATVNVSNTTTPPPDTSSPTVSISSPTAGQAISGNFTVTANAVDNVGVTKVEFYVDGQLKNSDTTAPYEFSLDTKTLTNASHIFSAKAFDAAGNQTTSANVSATVSNQTFINEDVNQNGCVDLTDLTSVIAAYGTTENPGRKDVNRNGVVDLVDLTSIIAKYGQCT